MKSPAWWRHRARRSCGEAEIKEEIDAEIEAGVEARIEVRRWGPATWFTWPQRRSVSSNLLPAPIGSASRAICIPSPTSFHRAEALWLAGTGSFAL